MPLFQWASSISRATIRHGQTYNVRVQIAKVGGAELVELVKTIRV